MNGNDLHYTNISGRCRTRLELSAVLAASSPVQSLTSDDVSGTDSLESRTIRFQLYMTVSGLEIP